MERASSHEMGKSPREIEEGIKSTQTVTWDPFTVLPKEIYLEIFNKLDNSADKQNFMNAHMEFYNLFKTKRTRFLFQDVFKKVIKLEERSGGLTRQDVLNFRLVCHDWDKTVQNYFQLHDTNFLLSGLTSVDGASLGIWTPADVVHRRSEAFNWNKPFNLVTREQWDKVDNGLTKFSVTHPPSKNPFVSRKLHICPQGQTNNIETIRKRMAAVDALLEMYGKHIWHFELVTSDLKAETFRRLAKWLSLMPELKTLDLFHPNEIRQRFRLEHLIEYRNLELIQPEMKKLVALKSRCLPSIVFNKLFGNLKELEQFQILLLRKNESELKEFVVPTKGEKLTEAFFMMTGMPDFFDYLDKAKARGESFPNLKTLTISEVKAFMDPVAALEWTEWRKVFNVLEEKFPALETLTLRLPRAMFVSDVYAAKCQSLEATLNLTKLKKLWISLPNLTSIDFLLPCKSLEELKVTLETPKCHCEDWAAMKKREKIKFNVDLSTLWESNIWEEFPKLRILQIDTLRFYKSKHFHRYEKAGQGRKYQTNYVSSSNN